jgi:hypothetical protein
VVVVGEAAGQPRPPAASEALRAGDRVDEGSGRSGRRTEVDGLLEYITVFIYGEQILLGGARQQTHEG